jgi:RNA polymerase sigma factor (sigma-70 family)
VAAGRGHRLSADEERGLAERIKAGDTAAQQQLITANLALVLRTVEDYRQTGIPWDDLVQEGNLGLIRAAQNFDPSTHTARFATYASFWIRASLVRALAANSSLIQLPESASRRLHNRHRRAMGEFRPGSAAKSNDADPKPPGPNQAAQDRGAPPWRLKGTHGRRRASILSLGLEEQLMADGRPVDQDVLDGEDRALLCAAIRRLNWFEAWVIRERFGLREPAPEFDVPGRAQRRKRRGRVGAPAQVSSRSDLVPAGAARPRPSSYRHRAFRELELDCGLPAYRLRRVERIALEKLRAFLDQRASGAVPKQPGPSEPRPIVTERGARSAPRTERKNEISGPVAQSGTVG